MITDRERDEMRLAAQVFVRDTQEEWKEFKLSDREYLEEPEIDLAELEEAINAQVLQQPQQAPSNAQTPTQARPEPIPGLEG